MCGGVGVSDDVEASSGLGEVGFGDKDRETPAPSLTAGVWGGEEWDPGLGEGVGVGGGKASLLEENDTNLIDRKSVV